jgi:hypothetical protein
LNQVLNRRTLKKKSPEQEILQNQFPEKKKKRETAQSHPVPSTPVYTECSATWIQHTPTRSKGLHEHMRNPQTTPTAYKETEGGEAQNPLFLSEKKAF